MILRINAIECPACTAWTLEWSDEVSGSACETCGYAGNRDDADREPVSLRVLRRWRYELANPLTNEPTGERGKMLRMLKIGNAAALADLCGVPRVGDEQDADVSADVAIYIDRSVMSATGGAHFTWKDAR